MATLALGLTGALLGGLGGLFGNKPQTTTTTSDQTVNGNQNLYGTTATTHNWDPASINLKDALTNLYTQNITQPYDVQGEVNRQIQGNNAASTGSMQATSQMLAARGLNTSPVAANAIIQNQGQRAALNAQSVNSAPQILQNMFAQRMGAAGGFFNSMPVDTTQQTQQSADTSQTSHGTSTQVGTGNQMAGGFSSLGSGLAYLAGNGVFGKKAGG